MSSSSTTWTTDTNTKSGVVQIYTSNVSVLRLVADEGTDAILDLFADQGDDNADKWRMWVNASDDDLHFSNYTSGTAYTDILTLQDGGNVGIGTADPGQNLEVKGSGATIEINATGSTNATLMLSDTGGNRWSIYNDALGAGTDDTLIIGVTDGLNAMSIVPTGNVGIGTIAPNKKFHIQGNDVKTCMRFFSGTTDSDISAGGGVEANIDLFSFDIPYDIGAIGISAVMQFSVHITNSTSANHTMVKTHFCTLSVVRSGAADGDDNTDSVVAVTGGATDDPHTTEKELGNSATITTTVVEAVIEEAASKATQNCQVRMDIECDDSNLEVKWVGWILGDSGIAANITDSTA